MGATNMGGASEGGMRLSSTGMGGMSMDDMVGMGMCSGGMGGTGADFGDVGTAVTSIGVSGMGTWPVAACADRALQGGAARSRRRRLPLPAVQSRPEANRVASRSTSTCARAA